MTIREIQWHPYRLPLRNSFTTAHNVLAVREGAIVEVITDEGLTGIGEIAPLPEFGGETLAIALSALPDLTARLRRLPIKQALAQISTWVEAGTIPSSTACGLESALFDALGKLEGRSVGALLTRGNDAPSLPCPAIAVNAVIGAATTEDAAALARQFVKAGFGCIKLKMGCEIAEEIERVAAVREAIGPEIDLRLDANEGWNFVQAHTLLTACSRYNIQYVEQPLQAHDLAGMRRLRYAVPIPLAADEGLRNLASARRILAEEAASIFIIKPQLVGGFQVSQQIIREAAAHGVQSVVTSAIESGIGLAGALHLVAASPEVTLACGLATLHLLADDLLVDDLPIHNGTITVPVGLGLGVKLDREALAYYR